MPFALVTGGSKGIGKAIALGLAARGYDLLLVARNAEELDAVAQEATTKFRVQAFALPFDLSRSDAPASVADWCLSRGNDLEVLVNNAGYGLSGSFEKYSEAEHQAMLQVNVNTLVGLTRLLLPALHKRPKAFVLNIASSAAYQAVPFLGAYAASKAFVLSFSRSLRFELKNTGVSVTCICPGPVDTNFVNRAQVGAKGQKAAARFNMTPEKVGAVAVESLLRGKAEVIVGASNKLSAFFAWMMPKNAVESIAAKLYD